MLLRRFVEPQSPGHRLAHGLATEAIEEFLAELAALIEPVEVHGRNDEWNRRTPLTRLSANLRHRTQAGYFTFE
jgi:hypothetical protein